MTFKIVAKQEDHRILLTANNETGIVVDLFYKVRYPEFNIQSILARGYWENTVDDQKTVEKVLKFPIEGAKT